MSTTLPRPAPGAPAGAPAAPALQTTGLTVGYGGRDVLHEVDVRIPAGAITGVVGPNGAGKSTLVRAALGLLPRTGGDVLLLGEPLRRVRREIAYVPQQDGLAPDFPITAVQVVEMGRYPRRGWWRFLRDEDDAAVDAALRRTGVADLAEEPFEELSGGQRQRVLLARALAQGARLLVLDEPFSAVDARTEAALLDLLDELCHEPDEHGVRRSAIVVHHDLRTVRDRFDHAVLLAGGVLGDGPVAEVLTPATLERAYGIAPLADRRPADPPAPSAAAAGDHDAGRGPRR